MSSGRGFPEWQKGIKTYSSAADGQGPSEKPNVTNCWSDAWVAVANGSGHHRQCSLHQRGRGNCWTLPGPNRRPAAAVGHLPTTVRQPLTAVREPPLAVGQPPNPAVLRYPDGGHHFINRQLPATERQAPSGRRALARNQTTKKATLSPPDRPPDTFSRAPPPPPYWTPRCRW